MLHLHHQKKKEKKRGSGQQNVLVAENFQMEHDTCKELDLKFDTLRFIARHTDNFRDSILRI